MVVSGKNPYTPGMEGGCTKTAYEAWGEQCMTKDPCTTCKYWPIYPCHSIYRPMVECLHEYTNDDITVN